jgi:SAM-dependent methyltransferase
VQATPRRGETGAARPAVAPYLAPGGGRALREVGTAWRAVRPPPLRAARAHALDAARASAFGPADYVRQESFATAAEMVALARAASVEPGTRVLELCCGPGGPALHLAATLGCRVTAVDSSAGALLHGREMATSATEASRVSFLAADALHLPLSGPFDAALLFETMLSIEDKKRLLCEVRRVLRPGGRLAVTLEEGEPLSPEEIASIPEGDRIWVLPEARFLDMLEGAGFHLTRREDHTAAHADVAFRLLRAYRAHRREIEAQLGQEGYEALVVSHERWVRWLDDGRVRKLALVATRTE